MYLSDADLPPRRTLADNFKRSNYSLNQVMQSESCVQIRFEMYEARKAYILFRNIVPQYQSRFRNLVDIFHGGHTSRANTVLIDRRWVSMFDNGAFHLRFDDEQIYPVPMWGDASAFIPTCSPINRSSSLRPRVKSVFRGPIGPDKELVSLHALILQTWYDTGLSERLVADIHLVDDMPSISQQVSVLGDSMFSQILQHRLALL
ncbi:hypothetical protein FS842_000569 [Serendipita sp. 407]|nr:hypothetical protein FS842_000569 [Serendipita sp. 407]